MTHSIEPPGAALDRAYRALAPYLGAWVLALVRRRAGRAQVLGWAAALRHAAEELEAVAGRGAEEE